MKRRDFLKAAGGSTVAATAAAGGAAAQEGGGSQRPQFGSWLQGVDGGYEDLRGNSEVTVQVGAQGNGGAYAFAPAGIWVDEGTTVTFEWTGEGGGHNVVGDSGPASSDLNSGDPVSEGGTTYEFTFENGGITNYYCDPHLSLGMKGAVAVGGGVPTESTGGGRKELHELGVPIQAHYVGAGTVLMILVSLIYSFFILKYGESPNTGNSGGGES
jgi:halocyanin-like protein